MGLLCSLSLPVPSNQSNHQSSKRKVFLLGQFSVSTGKHFCWVTHSRSVTSKCTLNCNEIMVSLIARI